MKVKVFGAGSIGNHLTQAARRMGWSVLMCDPDPAALTRTREQIYPQRYGAWDADIQLTTLNDAPRGGFDMIFLGTPPDIRFSLARECLSEKPRLIQLEKPLCGPSLKGAQEFADAARAANVLVCVGYDHAIGRAAATVRQLLAENNFGPIETIDVEFREHWGGIFSAHAWLAGPHQSYLGFWERGGGASGEHSHATNLWQDFAHACGAGRITEVAAALEFVKTDQVDYDKLCALTVRTDKGLVGRIVQDVVTKPPRKWARVQAERGFVEWHCGGHPEGDLVRYQHDGAAVQEVVIAKKRPDDFFWEMEHFDRLLKGAESLDRSPISLQRGLDTMLVVAAAHRAHRERRVVTIDYAKGCRPEAIG